MDLCLVKRKSFAISRQIQLVIASVKASAKVEVSLLYLGVRWTAKCDRILWLHKRFDTNLCRRSHSSVFRGLHLFLLALPVRTYLARVVYQYVRRKCPSPNRVVAKLAESRKCLCIASCNQAIKYFNCCSRDSTAMV
jgi:hypothetical protein